MPKRMHDEPVEKQPVRGWYVLVEETIGSGESQRWSLTSIRSFEGRDQALREAAMSAREFVPRHPSMERKRRIFRVGDDTWVVYVEGAMRTYHFRVCVARDEGED
jgi:hypothetical protein